MPVNYEEWVRSKFPRMGWFDITSPADGLYNCIAWAVNDTRKWWQPDAYHQWPAECLIGYEIEIYVAMFRSLGYEECDSQDLEDGTEKIVMFSDSNGFSHVARQLASGNWTSKFGEYVDIEHESPEDLVSPFYGRIYKVLKRQAVSTPGTPPA